MTILLPGARFQAPARRVGRSLASRGTAWVAALLALGMCGCEPERQAIRADGQTVFPGARALVGLLREESHPEDARPAEKAPSTHGCLAVEATFQAAWGETETFLEAGAPAELNHQLLTGPAQMDLGYDILGGSTAIRGGVWFREIVGLEGIGGFSLHQVNLSAEVKGLADEDSVFSLGPLVGAQLSVRPLGHVQSLRWLTLYGRVEYSYEFGEYGKDTEFTSEELGIELGPLHHVGVLAGWRWWSLERDQVGGDSEVGLDLDGPVVGLLIRF